MFKEQHYFAGFIVLSLVAGGYLSFAVSAQEGTNFTTPAATQAVEETMPNKGQNNNDDKDDEDQNSRLSPQELKDVLRSIKDLRKEVQRLHRQTKKLKDTNAIQQEVEGLLAKLIEHERNIKSPPSDISQRDAVNAFWDERLWDVQNDIRRKIDLPMRIKEIEKELGRAERTLKKKRVQKYAADYVLYGQNALVQIRTALETARASFAAGDYENAEESLNEATSDMHPGEIEGVYEMLSNLLGEIGRIKDKELRQSFLEILDPVISALQAADFREANESLNEVQQELFPLINQAREYRGKKRVQFDDKLRKLEDIINAKLETGNNEQDGQ